jgi:methyltransferase
MSGMHSGLLLLAYLTLQRTIELLIARRNTAALLAKGAYEVDAGHYPAIVTLHASWLATLWIFGWNHDLLAAPLAVFALLQVGRFWVLQTLGDRWTTRIVILPGAPPITTGPFRFLRHPNYLIVALELPCASLALGLPWHAVVFGLLNFAMLAYRIRCEDAAFAQASALG